MAEDPMDGLLRRSMREPAPQLSKDFERRLQRRLAKPPLSPKAKRLLWMYTAAALILSEWALSPLPLWANAGAIAVAAAIGAVLWAVQLKRV